MVAKVPKTPKAKTASRKAQRPNTMSKKKKKESSFLSPVASSQEEEPSEPEEDETNPYLAVGSLYNDYSQLITYERRTLSSLTVFPTELTSFLYPLIMQA